VYRAHHPVVISTAATGTASVVQVAALETAAREATPTSPPLQAAVRAAEPSEEPTPVVSVPQASPREKSPASLAANAVPQVESTLEIETRLLRDAEALRRAGNGARALVLLDEHAARFPNGVLAEERTAARVFALCDLGRVSDASGEAQRFLAERPRSPLAARVRASCAEALSR
jgi:hypothetical protein